MVRILGGGLLTLVVIAVILVVAVIPLLFVFRSTCQEGGERATKYSLVPPWDDPPADCRDNQRGYEFLLDEIGL